MSATNGGPAPNPMKLYLQFTEEMMRSVLRYQPEGILEVLAMYRMWSDGLAEEAKVWREIHKKAAEAYPLKPAVVAIIEGVAKNQDKTAQAAAQICRIAERLHSEDLERLRDLRNRMWDLRANPGAR